MIKQLKKVVLLTLTIIVLFFLQCISTDRELVKKIKAKGKRYAIVVGINDYEDQNPDQVQKSKPDDTKKTETKSFKYKPTVIDSLPKGVAKTYKNSLGIEFVLVPSGEYDMGCSKEDTSCYSWEKPAHRVKITKPFYMSKYEVTQAQWKKLMGNNPSYFDKCGDNCPVEKVSWNDVQKFIEFLNKKEANDRDESKTRLYRLPTEAEWEYAARGGKTTKYPWGDELGKNNANCDGCGSQWDNKSTSPVGSFKPNAFGLYDMSGNVWEWTADWYDSSYYNQFENKMAVDPKGPDSGSNRVSRGGSWFGYPRDARSSDRSYWSPGIRLNFIGFRLFLSSF